MHFCVYRSHDEGHIASDKLIARHQHFVLHQKQRVVGRYTSCISLTPQAKLASFHVHAQHNLLNLISISSILLSIQYWQGYHETSDGAKYYPQPSGNSTSELIYMNREVHDEKKSNNKALYWTHKVIRKEGELNLSMVAS